MKYRVCKMVDGNGDGWYQVQSSRYGFFWRWDCSWPWASKVLAWSESVAAMEHTPRRFDAIDEAREHIAEVKRDDLAKQCRIVDVFSDTGPADAFEAIDVATLFGYAVTPDVLPKSEPAVTETKPTKPAKRAKRGRKKTS